MFIRRENYITDTCVADFKDTDGDILKMISDVDEEPGGDDLCYGDRGVREIWDEEDEESCAIQEENQYDLIICRTI